MSSDVVCVRHVLYLVKHRTRPELVPQLPDQLRHDDAVGVQPDQSQHHDSVLAQVLRGEPVHHATIGVGRQLAHGRQMQLDEAEALASEADLVDPH